MAAAVAALGLVVTACGDRETRTNVRPPAPGVPGGFSEVQGIYRTIHQGLLQLRGNGDFVLVVPDGFGASAGSYTLEAGMLAVTTDKCGADVGEYRVVVTGVQEAGKASLEFTDVGDACTERSFHLTAAPWVYANS